MHEAGPCRHYAVDTAPGSGHNWGLQAAPDALSAGQQPQQDGSQVHLAQRWQLWLQPRGRVKQVLNRLSVTSGRRLDAWGALKATYIHAVIGASWFFQRDPVRLKELYHRLYTDAFR